MQRNDPTQNPNWGTGLTDHPLPQGEESALTFGRDMFYKPRSVKKRKFGNLVMLLTLIAYIAMVPIATGVALDAAVKGRRVPDWAEALSLPAQGFYSIVLAIIPSSTPGTVFLILYILMALPIVFIVLAMLLAASKRSLAAGAMAVLAGLLFLPAGALAIIGGALYVREAKGGPQPPPNPMLAGPW